MSEEIPKIPYALARYWREPKPEYTEQELAAIALSRFIDQIDAPVIRGYQHALPCGRSFEFNARVKGQGLAVAQVIRLRKDWFNDLEQGLQMPDEFYGALPEQQKHC